MAFSPASGGSVALFRVIFGLIGFVIVARMFARGWIGELYIEPEYHFSYLGFGWARPWPEWGMYLHFAALGVLSLCVAVGYRYRLSVALYFVGFTYVELLERALYLNHHYWISLAALLMIFLPLNRVASVDAWRNPRLSEEVVPAWTLWALRAQVGVVYIFAGIAKLNADWLFRAQPMRIWLYQHGDMPLVGSLLQEVWVAYAMSWAGAAFDLTIFGFLLWKRARFWAYLSLIGFHIATWALFPHLGIFPWMMIGASLVFFNFGWPRQKVARLLSWKRSQLGRVVGCVDEASRRATPELTWRTRAILVGVGAFALIQVLMPLRHFAYPSNVRWSEEGYLFSWRVMLTEKVGFTQYRVRDFEARRGWIVSPDEYLTPLQVERMSIQPSLILQTAHFIAEDFRNRGYDEVTVKADVFVTWNGRPNRRLIDPEVDLASVRSGLAPKDWILPYESTEPDMR